MAYEVAAGQVFEARVLGQADGQAIINVHRVIVTAAPLPSNSQELGRSIIEVLLSPGDRLTQSSNNWGVARLDLVQIVGVVPNLPPPQQPFRFVYGLTDSILPVPPEGLGTAVAPYLPTYAAVAARFGGILAFVGLPQLNIRGGARFGSLPEASTDNALGGNVLTAAAHVAWSSYVQRYTQPQVGVTGIAYRFTIASLTSNVGFVNLTSRFANIQTAAVNPYVSSQVSRKRRAVLG